MVYNAKNQIIKKTSKSNSIYNYAYDANGNVLDDGIK